eukprot:IDg4962t1
MPIPLTLVYAVEQSIPVEAMSKTSASADFVSKLKIQVMDNGELVTNFAVTSWVWGEPEMKKMWDIFGEKALRIYGNMKFGQESARRIIRDVLEGKILITHRENKEFKFRVLPDGVKQVACSRSNLFEVSAKIGITVKFVKGVSISMEPVL